MKIGRQQPVFHGEEHLKNTGDPGRGFKMTDIGFHRTQSAVRGLWKRQVISV